MSRNMAKGGVDAKLRAMMRCVETGDIVQAETLSRAFLARHPAQPLALKVLTYSLVSQGRFDEALPIASQALRVAPNDAENLSNLGIIESELMEWEKAISHFQRAIHFQPNDPDLFKNLGTAYFRMQRWDDAVAPLLRAIELHPGDFTEAIKLLAAALLNGRRREEALGCFSELVAANPEDWPANYLWVYTALTLCQWKGIPDVIERLWTRSDSGPVLLDTPLYGLAFPGVSNAHIGRFTGRYAADWLPKYEGVHIPVLRRRTPLRVGYLSGDFRDHPVGWILQPVIATHNRSRMEVVGLSIGHDDGSASRRFYESNFDRFHDLSNLSTTALAEYVRSLELDILIDLSGWTNPNRIEAMALRCAPVQAGWLGYAATSGDVRVWDYLIADTVVVPVEQAGDYVETLAYLPGSYMPLLPDSPVSTSPITRADCGLPESGFVFCSLNNSYKFNPASFDLWCRLLSALPSSVLWLAHMPAVAAANLRSEALARGVASDRLIFADYIADHDAHKARIALADLALDTFPYNSHSTGAETLMAGVPMVSLIGTTFAGRVGASMLHELGLAELMCATESDYYQCALDLASNPVRLDELRARLGLRISARREHASKNFAAELETIYERMVDAAGDSQRHVLLPDPARSGL